MNGIGWNPAIEAMFITAPAPRSTMPGSAAWVSSVSARTLRVTSSLSRSSGNVWKTPLVPKPALLHRPAIGSLRSRSANFVRALPSPRSSGMTSIATEYSLPTSLARSSRRSRRRATSSSGKPRRARPRVSSAPMPDEAPVMTTVVSVSGFGRLMMSPMDPSGRAHERLASFVEGRCVAGGFAALGRIGVGEHGERAVAHAVHDRRVDRVGDSGELPQWRAGAAGPVHDRVRDHAGRLIRRQRWEPVIHRGRADHRRAYQRHMHGGEFDVVIHDFGLQRVAKAVQCGLAGDVGAEARRAGLHADRGDIDDLPEAAFPHPGDELEDELDRAEVVQLHGPLIVVNP